MNLTDISDDNIADYKKFEQLYSENLSMYLSRIYPDKKSIEKWCYINVNDENIGSIWLEKVSENTLKLGVFIADEKYRNKGYGTFSIKEMLNFAKHSKYEIVTLNVRITNHMAINTYQNLGFRKTNQYVKNNGIEVISMIYEL
ncbi:MAG: GNAT family N-acetyltransferase [Eubacterium sp.]|jgi:RimJ/RimL family protein N-acetyltransferase